MEVPSKKKKTTNKLRNFKQQTNKKEDEGICWWNSNELFGRMKEEHAEVMISFNTQNMGQRTTLL